MTVAATLARLPLFSGLDEKELEILAGLLSRRRLSPGGVLFREGDRAPSCFVVVAGKVGVYQRLPGGQQERLAVLDTGALVGHMALIDGKPRSATCKAEGEAAVLIELGRSEFDRLYSANSPFAFKILDRIAMDLVQRLRGVTDHLARVTTEPGVTRGATQSRARAVAELLAGRGPEAFDVGDIDLDAITFEIPEGARRDQRRD